MVLLSCSHVVLWELSIDSLERLEELCLVSSLCIWYACWDLTMSDTVVACYQNKDVRGRTNC